MEHVTGYLRSLDTKSLVIDSSDHRHITMRLDEKASVPKDLKAGDYVDIEARKDENGLYTATSLKKTAAPASAGPPPGATAGAQQPSPSPADTAVIVEPNTSNDPDEMARPHLKRGVPQRVKKRQEEEREAPVEVASNAPPPAPAPEKTDDGSGLVGKAREAAFTFVSSLPNYLVHEFATRYYSDTRPVDWKAQDVVSADVVYEDGKERYENVAVNGKKTDKPEESGTWSTGEFGTILEDLFSPATAARFHLVRMAVMNGRSCDLYDFTVERANSHWKVAVPGQYTLPGYKGSVWIAKDNGRVLRLEMQAVSMPDEFPEDKIETAVDYDLVTLGEQKYLLPVHAEVLGCQRGSNDCMRNVIDFRNYRKFAGESTVTYEK